MTSINEVLNHYWNTVGNDQDTFKIRGDNHFSKLNDYLNEKISAKGIPQSFITGAYRNRKNWDMHFSDIDVAIEYKTFTAKNIIKARNNRIEEALGSSIDLKRKHPHYKLGFIAVFAFRENSISAITSRQIVIEAFDRMINDGHYDMFLPIQTMGIDNHFELSEKYSLDAFINSINYNIPQENGTLNINQSSLTRFFS
jgi:predicted nucleotidyltransferase